MPRTPTLTVTEYGPLDPRRWHLCVILVIEVLRKAKTLKVTVQLQGPKQDGRRLQIRLPLQVLPSNLTASFFEAAGFMIKPGARIAPDEAVGMVIRVRFEKTANGYEPVAFAPIEEKKRAPEQPESNTQAAS